MSRAHPRQSLFSKPMCPESTAAVLSHIPTGSPPSMRPACREHIQVRNTPDVGPNSSCSLASSGTIQALHFITFRTDVWMLSSNESHD